MGFRQTRQCAPNAGGPGSLTARSAHAAADLAPLVPAPAVASASTGAASLLKTIGTVHGLVSSGLKRHPGFLATTGACRAEHHPRCAASTVNRSVRARRLTFGFALGAAVGAASWLRVPAAGVVVPLTTGKGECLPAIAAAQRRIARHLGTVPPWKWICPPTGPIVAYGDFRLVEALRDSGSCQRTHDGTI
jgi:hypothetical protein